MQLTLPFSPLIRPSLPLIRTAPIPEDLWGVYEFDQQGANWGEKQDPAADQWGPGQVMGRDDLDSEGWDDMTGRRNFGRNWAKNQRVSFIVTSPNNY